MTLFKQTPQVFNADYLKNNWYITKTYQDKTVLARPFSYDSIKTRFYLAWKVFKGDYDALSWTGQ